MAQWEWHNEVYKGCQWNALYNVRGQKRLSGVYVTNLG